MSWSCSQHDNPPSCYSRCPNRNAHYVKTMSFYNLILAASRLIFWIYHQTYLLFHITMTCLWYVHFLLLYESYKKMAWLIYHKSCFNWYKGNSIQKIIIFCWLITFVFLVFCNKIRNLCPQTKNLPKLGMSVHNVLEKF